jgi:hypothetical protein
VAAIAAVEPGAPDSTRPPESDNQEHDDRDRDDRLFTRGADVKPLAPGAATLRARTMVDLPAP